MNVWTLSQDAAAVLAKNPLLARLTLISIELAFLAGGVVLLMSLLRIRTPRVRALLWLLVLAKPILGLTLGTPLPVIHFQTPQAVAQVAPEPMADTCFDAATPTELPADRPSRASGSFVEPAIPPRRLPETGLSSMTGLPSMPVAAPRRPLPLGNVLIGFWLIGVMGLTGLTARDQVQIRKIRRAALEPPEGVARRFHELAQALHLKHCPRVGLTDALQSPALAGLWRPDVLLPRWLADEADTGQLDWLLRHELMHRKLNDPVALVVRRLAEILFFFHPAVWWAGKKWEEAMELACDRALLHTEADARNYAGELYRVLESQSARRRLFAAGGLFATRTQIGKRIAALLSDPLRSPAHLSLLALGGLALVALISLPVGFGLVHAQSTKPPTEKAIASVVKGSPESAAIPLPESTPQPPREISGDFVFDKEIPLYVQMASADGKGNASLQWIRFMKHGEYWFGERKSLNTIRVDLRVVLGLSNAKWRIALALLDKDDRILEQAESIYEDHAFASTTRYISEANVFMMLPMMDKPTTPTRYRLRLEQAPADAEANAEFCHPWPSPNPTTPLAWGKEVNGLRATIEFIPEREAYALGEKIGVCFRVQNVSTRTISMALPRKAQCKAVVLGAGSKDVPTSRGELLGPVGYMELRLAPGEETVLYNASLLFGGREMKTEEPEYFYGTNVRCGSGRYLVKYLNLPDNEESKTLETGFREVIVRPTVANANPAHGPNGDGREASPTAGRRLTGAVPKSADNPLGLDEDIEWKFFDTKRDFRTIQYGLISYCSNNHALPTKLADLNRSHMGDLPKDPFYAGPLRVIIEPTKVILASVGPDGKWDGGKPINPADPTLAGDLVYELTMETVEQLDLLDKVFQPFLPAMRPLSERGRMRPASTSDPARPNIVWGPEVKGLRAALEFVPEKKTYALGDLVGIRFHVQNVSARTRQLAFTELLQGSGFTAVDEKGKAYAAYNCYSLGSWPRLQRRVLKPQEEVILEYGHVCLGELVNTPAMAASADVTPPAPKAITEGIAISCNVDVPPGRHFIWYDLRLPDTGGSEVLEQDDWRGTVQCGVREIVVAAKPADSRK